MIGAAGLVTVAAVVLLKQDRAILVSGRASEQFQRVEDLIDTSYELLTIFDILTAEVLSSGAYVIAERLTGRCFEHIAFLAANRMSSDPQLLPAVRRALEELIDHGLRLALAEDRNAVDESIGEFDELALAYLDQLDVLENEANEAANLQIAAWASRRQFTIQAIATACAGFLLLVTACHRWLSLRLVRPVQALVAAAERSIDHDEPFRLAPFGPIEVRTLTKQLQSLVSSLESRVADRTNELEVALHEQKILGTQLLHAQKMESIGQLAAGIAHEINTPIQYVGDNTRFVSASVVDLLKLIDQYAAMLASAKEGEVSREQIAELESAVEELDLVFVKEEIPKAIEQTLAGVSRVAEIVRAMKDFSHPGTDEKTPTDLNKAIESTITVCRARWKYVADLETDFQDGLPAVPCQVGEFNQVILNIVVNAADAIGDIVGDGGEGKGRITVSTRRDGEFVEIRVSDTGGGIPEEIRQNIFDPFFTTKEVGKGTGQGLAISHDVIVNKHGGTIDIEVDPGVGTTFIVRLPIEAESAIESKQAA